MTKTQKSLWLAGAVQGLALWGLHVFFSTRLAPLDSLISALPLYSVAILCPLIFSLLRGDFSFKQSAWTSALLTLPIALSGLWVGMGFFGASEATPLFLNDAWSRVQIFALSAVGIVALALPFLQGRLREGRWTMPYRGLFDDAWRNTLLLGNALFFLLCFWALLALWAGLFLILKISFFSDLFTHQFFVYCASALAVHFAMSLDERQPEVLVAIRRYLLNFQTRLLPLAASIVIAFTFTLPVSGLSALWGTGHATFLLLFIQLTLITLINAAWQDGQVQVPFSKVATFLIRVSMVLLPILSGLSIWAMHLRVQQYGWSVERVWASAGVALMAMYALGYAFVAMKRQIAKRLVPVNVLMALCVALSLWALNSPLLEAQGIAAHSQRLRLIHGQTPVDQFDFEYLRFQLGTAGLQQLKELSAWKEGDPDLAKKIREKAQYALAQKQVSSTANRHAPTAAQLQEKSVSYGAKDHAVKVPDSCIQQLSIQGLTAPQGELQWLNIDLGGAAGAEGAEWVLMHPPYPVYSAGSSTCSLMGHMSFGVTLSDSEVHQALQQGNFKTAPEPWSQLLIGRFQGSMRPIPTPVDPHQHPLHQR